jgi:hypothetical protein
MYSNVTSFSSLSLLKFQVNVVPLKRNQASQKIKVEVLTYRAATEQLIGHANKRMVKRNQLVEEKIGEKTLMPNQCVRFTVVV